MTTQPAPVTDNSIPLDVLSPQDAAYLARLTHALRCGVPGCECADGPMVHCPSHSHAEVPTLTIAWDERRECLSFQCLVCPPFRILDALAKRGLAPEGEFYNSGAAQAAGLQPFRFLIQQPQDWLWPNRIPIGKLTLIAGYPSSGKTSIALDIAARVSRGAAAPDQPDAAFPSAPVVLALLDDNPKADVLPILRLFGADLDRVYLADLLSPTHPADYYPDDPPDDDDDGPYSFEDDDDEDDDDVEYLFDNDGNEITVPRRKPVGVKAPVRDPFWTPATSGSKLTAPWPRLDKVMGRLANYLAEGKAALLVVDQVEDLAAMHRTHVATVLGMLKALAARSGAAVVALAHNPAQNYPRAVTAMQNRLPLASVVFTTAVVGPGNRRFLVPLRPAMSDDAPAIPFVLPPQDAVAVAWRKPILPVHLDALAKPRPNDGAKVRAAQSLLVRALAGGPRPAAEIEREAALLGVSRATLVRARALCKVSTFRVSTPGVPSGAGAWHWSLPAEVVNE